MSLKMKWLIDNLNTGQDNRPPGAKQMTDCPLTKYKKVLYIDGQDLMANTPAGFWSNNFQNAIQLL